MAVGFAEVARRSTLRLHLWRPCNGHSNIAEIEQVLPRYGTHLGFQVSHLLYNNRSWYHITYPPGVSAVSDPTKRSHLRTPDPQQQNARQADDSEYQGQQCIAPAVSEPVKHVG